MERFFGLRRTWLVALAVAFATAGAADLRAQPGGVQLKSLDEKEKEGDVAEVGPGVLQLRLPKGGTLWQAIPAPNAVIEVTGQASREMLQPKQFVSCAVVLDELGKVTAPATQVIFPGGGTPGVIAGGLGIAEPGAKKVGGKRPAGSYLVAGTIKQIDGDVVTVLAGRERFEITVPEDCELLVKTGNVMLAAPGDDVEVDGKYQQKGQLYVTSLKIKLSNPVAPPPAKNKAAR
jgi:hypothetical protein